MLTNGACMPSVIWIWCQSTSMVSPLDLGLLRAGLYLLIGSGGLVLAEEENLSKPQVSAGLSLTDILSKIVSARVRTTGKGAGLLLSSLLDTSPASSGSPPPGTTDAPYINTVQISDTKITLRTHIVLG
jgi:hypothetical protein